MSPIALLLIGMAVVLVGVLWLRLHAFLALTLAALAISVLTPRAALEEFAAERVAEGQLTEKQAGKFATQNAASRVAAEFGDGCRKVGILIAMAAIIGKCLLDSGAAQRIVQSILAIFGEWTGNFRSTPSPATIRRTVNISRLPVPLRAITTPLKI